MLDVKIRYRKYGIPTIDTMIPTGISIGENKFRAKASEKIRIIELISAAFINMLRCLPPHSFRAICGPRSPKKAIFPATAVATPARHVANNK